MASPISLLSVLALSSIPSSLPILLAYPSWILVGCHSEPGKRLPPSSSSRKFLQRFQFPSGLVEIVKAWATPTNHNHPNNNPYTDSSGVATMWSGTAVTTGPPTGFGLEKAEHKLLRSRLTQI